MKHLFLGALCFLSLQANEELYKNRKNTCAITAGFLAITAITPAEGVKKNLPLPVRIALFKARLGLLAVAGSFAGGALYYHREFCTKTKQK